MKLNLSIVLLAVLVGCGGDGDAPEVENQGVIKRLDASDPNGCWVTPKVGDADVDALFANQAEGTSIPFATDRYYVLLVEPWVRQQRLRMLLDTETEPRYEWQTKTWFTAQRWLFLPHSVGPQRIAGFDIGWVGVNKIPGTALHSTAPSLGLADGYTPEGVRIREAVNPLSGLAVSNVTRFTDRPENDFTPITSNESINSIAGLHCWQNWVKSSRRGGLIRVGAGILCLYNKPSNGNWIYFTVPFQLDGKPVQVKQWLQLLIQQRLADTNSVEFTQLLYSPRLTKTERPAYAERLKTWMEQRLYSIYRDCDPQASYDAGKLLPRQSH